MDQIHDIALDKIEPDPDQPRKHFDEAKLTELATSITEHGVRSPITVRPHPKRKDGYIIEVGERRWRASQIAGKETIPALIDFEEFNGGRVLELQLIENSQREDIGALEEGETYVRLKNEHGHTIETLMARTGKGRTHVYSRMKLTELAPAAKKALQTGKLQPAIADLASTIGDTKLQEQFVREVLGEKLDDEAAEDLEALGIHHEHIGEESKRWSRGEPLPLSFRAAKALLRRRFSTRLKLAKFDTGDATLTKAGACGPCPHRSGNQLTLPGGDDQADDLCTKTTCFEEKSQAAWKNAAAAAAETGMKVVPANDAKSVFTYDGVSVSEQSPYVDLTSELPWGLTKNSTSGKTPTFGKLLGKRAAEVPRVLVQDGAGAPRELLDKAAAVKLLTEMGKVDKPTKPSNSTSTKAKEPRIGGLSTSDINEQAVVRVLETVAAKVAADLDDKRELAWMRWTARAIFRDYQYSGGDAMIHMAERRGLDKNDSDELLALVEKAKTVGEVRALLVEIALAMHLSAPIAGTSGKHSDRDLFDDALKLAGVDWDKTVEIAKLAAEHEEASRKASAEAMAAAAKPKKAGAK